MYAVIRAGGKQYRVEPGSVIRVEKLAETKDHQVEFDTLVVSAKDGEIGRPQGEARVVGEVIGQVRGDKVLVFHYKRKKQYKKLRGHRQNYTAVRITEIAFDGQRFTAPPLETKAAPAPKAPEAEHAASAAHQAESAEEHKKKAAPKKHSKAEAHAAGKHAPSHHAGGGKAAGAKHKGGAKPKHKK